jgi:hypothetical protein
MKEAKNLVGRQGCVDQAHCLCMVKHRLSLFSIPNIGSPIEPEPTLTTTTLGMRFPMAISSHRRRIKTA